MAKARIDAGVCGFVADVRAVSSDGQNVEIAISSTCPHVNAAAPALTHVDAYTEIFTKPAQTRTYEVLSEHIPHVACPVYTGVLKTIEAAANLALPRTSSITFLEED
jgi:hypothetical protein